MLAWAFKNIIKAYWKYIPESKRRICIYNISCSNAVYQKVHKEGFWAGLKLYFHRRANCKAGYKIFLEDANVKIITIKGELIHESEINTLLIKEIRINK